MGRYKKRDLLYFGVDYIKAFIETDKENQLFKLSKNSNQLFLEFMGFNIAVSKIDITDKYIFFYSITYNNVNLGFMGFDGKNNKDFIEITGQGLTMFGVHLFYFLMSKLNLKFEKFKRFDVCFDLNIEVNYFHDKILDNSYKDEKNNYTTIKTKKNGVETIYFGKKSIKQNSYILNRIYNKIVDSQTKNKLFLYEDKYKNKDGTYKEVTRFESEIREDLAKFYDFESLKNNKLLYYRLVKSFYKFNSQFFKFLKDEDFLNFQKEYDLKNKINLENIKNGSCLKPNSKYQERILKINQAEERFNKFGKDFIDDKSKDLCLKMFVSFAKKLYKNGYSIEKMAEILKNNIEF